MKKTIISILIFTTAFIAIYAKSLWVDSGELFLDKKPLKIGDPVTIVFNHNTIIKYKAQSKQSATSKLMPSTSQSPMLSFLPALDYGSDMNYDKNLATANDGKLQGVITVAVTEVRDGNLVVGGAHTLIINGEEENISITAVASPKLIRKGIMIYSTDLINPVITYKGLAVSKGNKYTRDNVTMTTDETGKLNVEFTEDEKTQIIIDYLNKTLDTLFNY